MPGNIDSNLNLFEDIVNIKNAFLNAVVVAGVSLVELWRRGGGKKLRSILCYAAA